MKGSKAWILEYLIFIQPHAQEQIHSLTDTTEYCYERLDRKKTKLQLRYGYGQRNKLQQNFEFYDAASIH